MEVLLKQDVSGLGRTGEIRKVKDGYARNFLIPRGLAMPATRGLAKQADQLQQAAQRRQSRELATARALAARINAITLNFSARAGESGRLYGSITSAMIADALSEKLGQETDRRHLRLDHTLRELGEHDITFHVAPEVDATFKVIVVAEGELEKDTLTQAELEVAAEEQGVVNPDEIAEEDAE